LNAIVVSAIAASSLAVGITIAGCVIVAVFTFLSNDGRRPVLALFSRNLMVFMIPLLIIFTYLVIIWVAKVLTV
jgi:hypothetical protein